MTDEDRKKLIARFRAHEVVMWTDIDLAADEIERLMSDVAEWKQAAEVEADEVNRHRTMKMTDEKLERREP